MYGMMLYQTTCGCVFGFRLGLRGGRVIAACHKVSSEHGDVGAAKQTEYAIEFIAN